MPLKLHSAISVCLTALGLALVPVAAMADLPPLSHSLTQSTPKPAPGLALQGLDGREQDLAALRDKVVLVNFWATWCPPCRREMPSMQRLKDMLPGEAFEVLAVDVGEDSDTIEAFTSQLDTALSFPILLDVRSTAVKTWRVTGLPTTFLVDKQGRVVARAVGGREFDHPDIVGVVRELIGK